MNRSVTYRLFLARLLRTWILLSIAYTLHAQCEENIQKKMFLIGDSWATYMWYDNTLSTVAKDWGHSDVDYYTHLTLNELGSQTDDFLKPEKIAKLTQELAQRPELKVVHLSIAGNDFLGSWKVSFTQDQTQNLFNAMITRLDSIIDTIHALRPDIHIVWSGYTYTNFKESIEQIPSNYRSQHPFYSNWQNMESPTPEQINNLQNWFQQQVKDRYASDSKFTYVPASSILQYTFGQTNNLTIPPAGTYPPQTVDLPYGLIDYPSPLNSMRHYATIPILNIPIKDAFHLSAQGYYDFISYQFQKFYHHFLMNDDHTIADHILSGGVSNSGNIANLKVGKDGTNKYVGILNFDNTHWKSYVPEKISLYLRIDTILGANFFSSGDFEIDLIQGYFGDLTTLDPADFNSQASTTTTACVFGNNTQGKWIRIDFPVAVAQKFRNQATQLRIRHTGITDGTISLTNGIQQDFQAVLDVKYSTTAYPTDNDPVPPEDPIDVPEPPNDEEDNSKTPQPPIVSVIDEMHNEDLHVFPNPLDHQKLQISTSQKIMTISVYDLFGKLQLHYELPSQLLDLQSLQSGMYLLEIQSENKTHQIKLVKK